MPKKYSSALFALLLLLVAMPLSAQGRPAPLPTPLPPPGNTGRDIDVILNGDFEVDGSWTENSLTFPNDIICNAPCGDGGGTAGPRTGSGWVWFGGGSQEASRLSQALELTPTPGTTDLLRFYVWNGTVTRGRDSLYVLYTSLQLFELREGDQPYASGYSEVLLNLAGISNGDLTFNTTSMEGPISNFSLDDVSLIANVQDLVNNGSFENVGDPLAFWSTPGKSGDKALCSVSVPFGICAYQFKGSSTENSSLHQVLSLPSGGSMAAGSVLTGSFWAPIELGTSLRATLSVTYVDGTKKKVKLNASFNAAHDDSTLVPVGGSLPLELQQLPALLLTKPSTTGAVLKLTNTSLSKDLTFVVDNFSVAYIPNP